MDLRLIDHVALNVRNLDASVGWYHRVFGFNEVHRWNTTRMIGLGAIRLGLFLRPDAVPVENVDQTITITHVALLTDRAGLNAAMESLRTLEIPFDPPDDSGIALSIFVKDPDGHELEITAYHA